MFNRTPLFLRSTFLSVLTVLLCTLVAAQDKSHKATTDAHQITHVMKAQFDKPDAPLKVHPVVVEGQFAVAGWTQGPKGGRALLQKEHGQWRISVCGGDGLLQAKVLALSGMGESAAQSLAAKVQAAESKLSKAQRQQLALFQGEIQIDKNTAYGQAAQHGQH
jgi:hypothetical protein